MGELEEVTLVLKADGSVASVWATKEAAEQVVSYYNQYPFLPEGTPDPDAPYSTRTWKVRRVRE